MPFVAGRPIFAIIFLDQHRDPFTAHVALVKALASARFFSIGRPLPSRMVITGTEMN